MSNIFKTPAGDEIRLISIEINGTLHDVESIKGIFRVSHDRLYWKFEFQDGMIIEATGNITMMSQLVNKKEETK